jgi:phospholipid/cholesterol/gamma-HCH transport system ATP-binding protein
MLLYSGKIVFSGTAAETRATQNPMVRQFMEGTSEGPIQPM